MVEKQSQSFDFAQDRFCSFCVQRQNQEKRDLKKQSQLVPSWFGARTCKKGTYDNNPLCGRKKTKPILDGMRGFCTLGKRLPRPFGPRNDLNICVPLCLCGFVAESHFGYLIGTHPIIIVTLILYCGQELR